MREPITPVLTPEEFASLHDGTLSGISLSGIADILTNPYEHDDATDAARIIAAMNARLPDGDWRKITREMLSMLNDLYCRAEWMEDEGPPDEGWQSNGLLQALASVRALAAALASYLPPERP
jgi:hypothetical protein